MNDYQRLFASRGIEVVDNTAEEITALARELLATTAGDLVPSADEEARQARFDALVRAHGGYAGGRIGRDYLRSNPWVLPGGKELQAA
jgi:hypothetical protein